MDISAVPRLATRDLLERLVGFDTTSARPNAPLIDFVRDYLGGLGVTCRETRGAEDGKRNLHAIVGAPCPGGLALSGHVDTVPADPRGWTSDPFALREESGRLYGRGACDMKGFVASMLAAVPDLLAMRSSRPIHLFITFDEETTMAGARRLIADLGESGLTPALCVVGEPSLMEPIVAHKGRLAGEAIVRGKEGHSSDPGRGVNAIQAAAEAIAWLADEERRRRADGPFAEGFTPPHSTGHVGTIAGGSILNIIPDRCGFGFEWRTIPGDDPRALLQRLREHVARAIEPAMHAVDPRSGFTFEVRDWVPGMSLPPDHPLATLVRHAAGSNGAGHVSYATEGGLYQEAGIPTIVCGPGSITQAHAPDEWIAADQLDACDAFLRRLAARFVA